MSLRAAVGGIATVALVAALGYGALAQGIGRAPHPQAAPETVAGLSTADARLLQERFEKELWPALETSCAPCHRPKNASQFLLPATPRAAFLRLLAEGQFDPDNHASVVVRVTTTDKEILMPPPTAGALKEAVRLRFEAFAEAVQARQAARGIRADETFPAYLHAPFEGKRKDSGHDNTFLTFRQLRGKVATLFHDDGRREESDLFLENVHLFGGADFARRFDESSKATPTFLTGIELVARDIASRAYLGRSGPFAGFPATLPPPDGAQTPAAVRQGVAQLYRRLLFRDPTPAEAKEALGLLQRVYRDEASLARNVPQDLRFALTVTDAQGLSVTREVEIPVSADRHALTSEFVDQSRDETEGKAPAAAQTLRRTFAFVPGDTAQAVTVHNAQTRGNVSVSAITLRGPLPATAEKRLPVDAPSVSVEGAWRPRSEGGVVSYEDGDENKGRSRITFPVTVEKAGRYQVLLHWRRTGDPPPARQGRRRRTPASAAENVPVEVVSADRESHLALPEPPPVPPPGEAHFWVDQTIDARPYADLRSAFQFGPDDGIELKNEGTRRRVVADAVRLVPAAAPPGTAPLYLRAKEALGKEKWTKLDGGTFGAYNTIGPDLYQDEKDGKKAEGLSLLYRPQGTDGFVPATFYRVGVTYAGRVENETYVPYIVRARASSPIVQIVAPLRAHVGAPVTLDARSTYNLQRTRLTFRWRQVGGPMASLADPSAPKITFTAPARRAQQAAWEGLCRALMAHPDFLFTRPRALAALRDPAARRRLQLVKIAQDLLGRPPTAAETARVDAGAPLATLVDAYLDSPAFADFYFHRTRLYLESHGTPEQDEPARLWTYIATHDRPFSEILTADYTVDTAFRRQARPSYHGKTGVLTMKGFIEGKPSLPHFNYAAQVCEKFLGYVFEVPDEIVKARQGITASATTDPNSVCYTCHKVLTPLAYQRQHWDDTGSYRTHDETGLALDASDQGLVASYPFKGEGMEAFALQAARKERFLRTILQTHFVWYFGREMRCEADERFWYRRLWETMRENGYALRPLIRALVLSPEYLDGPSQTPAPAPDRTARQRSRLAAFHRRSGVE